jgi:hypothetical protein
LSHGANQDDGDKGDSDSIEKNALGGTNIAFAKHDRTNNDEVDREIFTRHFVVHVALFWVQRPACTFLGTSNSEENKFIEAISFLQHISRIATSSFQKISYRKYTGDYSTQVMSI